MLKSLLVLFMLLLILFTAGPGPLTESSDPFEYFYFGPDIVETAPEEPPTAVPPQVQEVEDALATEDEPIAEAPAPETTPPPAEPEPVQPAQPTAPPRNEEEAAPPTQPEAVEPPAPTEQNSIVGTWAWQVDLGPAMNAVVLDTARSEEEKMMAGAMDFSGAAFTVHFRFFEDGSFTGIIDEESLLIWRDEFIAIIEEQFYIGIERVIVDAGLNVSVEDFMKITGLSFDSILQELRDAYSDEVLHEMASSVMRGFYKLEDGKLYLYGSEGYDPNVYDYYTLSGDTLTVTHGGGMLGTIVGVAGQGDIVTAIYPIVLTRVE